MYVSFIYLRFNTYPEELICVGMIMLDLESKETKSKLSEKKMNMAKKVLSDNRSAFRLFRFSVENLIKFRPYNIQYLEHLNAHLNGLIKVDKPTKHECLIDGFDSFFEKRIERNLKKKNELRFSYSRIKKGKIYR